MEMERVRSKCPHCDFLPEELQEKILALMPFESVCTCRRVCRQWDAIFSSSKFITTKWAESPPNRNPLLVLIPAEVPDHCVAYCFYTHTWKKCTSSLLFIQEAQRDFLVESITCEGSAIGIFLVGMTMFDSRLWKSRRSDPPKKIVTHALCNPLTRGFFCLPALLSIETVMAIGIAEGAENTYKVMAVGRNNEDQIVEMYDSFEKTWSIVGHVPRNLNAIYPRNVVFSEGFFYCIAKETAEQTQIMGFSIQDGTFIFVPLPDIPGAEISPHLLACGSRILVAGLIYYVAADIIIKQKVIIWELEKVTGGLGLSCPSASSSLSWKEIARMPSSMWEDIRKIMPRPRPRITGVGDYVCFKVKMEVIVYSLSQKSWTWLPKCPFEDSFGTASALDLRPDMNEVI